MEVADDLDTCTDTAHLWYEERLRTLINKFVCIITGSTCFPKCGMLISEIIV